MANSISAQLKEEISLYQENTKVLKEAITSIKAVYQADYDQMRNKQRIALPTDHDVDEEAKNVENYCNYNKLAEAFLKKYQHHFQENPDYIKKIVDTLKKLPSKNSIIPISAYREEDAFSQYKTLLTVLCGGGHAFARKFINECCFENMFSLSCEEAYTQLSEHIDNEINQDFLFWREMEDIRIPNLIAYFSWNISLQDLIEKKAAKKSPHKDTNAFAKKDPNYRAAVEVILETGQASVSMLQRRLKLGYANAARLLDQLEETGVVGPFAGSAPRKILISSINDIFPSDDRILQKQEVLKHRVLDDIICDDFDLTAIICDDFFVNETLLLDEDILDTLYRAADSNDNLTLPDAIFGLRKSFFRDNKEAFDLFRKFSEIYQQS